MKKSYIEINYYNEKGFKHTQKYNSINDAITALTQLKKNKAKVEWCKAQLDLPEEEEDFETLLRQYEKLTEKISNHPEFEKILDAFNNAGTGSCGGNCDTCAGCH